MLARSKMPGKMVKLKTFSWNILRRFSDQSIVPKEKTSTSLKSVKKPHRPPFMKNIFLGVFDTEMLAYPELEKPALEELKKNVDPIKQYFRSNIDCKAISALKFIPNEDIQHLKNLGLFGQIIPSVYGGREQTATETALSSEIIAKDLDVAMAIYSHNFLGVQSLLMYGSQKQKDKYLPRLASGEWTAGFCMYESTSGSDLNSITTKAVPSEEHPDMYMLNGKKQWAVNGNIANLFIVLAKFDYITHSGAIMSIVRPILVERDSPGVTISQPIGHVGLNSSNVCEVHFKDTPVHNDCFIGDELKGMEMCLQIINSGRYNIGAIITSVLKRLFDDASEFIISREQLELPLTQNEQIQDKFTDIAAGIYALESMTYLTSMTLDKYDTPDCLLELAIIKVFSFTEGRHCLDMIMDLMGSRAFSNSEITQKYFRDFRTMEVFDGTTDVTKLLIALTGLQHAGQMINETVSKLRFPYEYPGFMFKNLVGSRRQINDDPKLILQLYEQLHPSLTDSANELEYCVLRFGYAVKVFCHRYGSDIVNQHIELIRLANAASKIYAMTAVLGRASRSYCIGLANAEMELKLAIKICYEYKKIVRAELNDLIDGLVMSGDALALIFGPDVFKQHGYFFKHPLERSF